MNDRVSLKIDKLASQTYKKNVLIVEDDGIQQIIMQRLAGRLGLNVLATVSEGKEAINSALSLNGVDLIMMDVRLNDDIDGIEAMTEIRQSSSSNVKVIYVTGNSEQKTKERAYKTNYEAFLEKPITEAKLRKAVTKAFQTV